MSITGKIKTLFSDKEKTEALFPRTKVSAVSDDNGVGLNVLLEQTVPMTRGGTGATNGAEGLANLFAAGGTVLSPYQYGNEPPSNPAVGQVYFEEATGTIADVGQDVAKALRAVNLLDNSDFRNPVNQRRQTSYTGNVLTIDRWNLWSPNSKMTATIEDGCVRFWNGDTEGASFGQKFPTGTFDSEKSYTFAYMTTDGTIRARSNPIEHYEWGEAVNIGLHPNETYLMVWAALYEGEYTVETLPPYVPDGYALEMVKSNGGATAIKKVWENASPGSSFAAQTVSLDLADAQLVAIVHKGSTSGTVDLITFVEMNKKTQTISYANAGGGSATVTYVRTVDVAPTGVTFAKGVTKQIGSTSVGEDNAKCIPLRIYAIKGVQ